MFGARYTEGAPWLASYSVDPRIRHLKSTLGVVLLCSSVHRRLMDQPLYCSAADAGLWREREVMVMAPPSMHDSAVSPCFHAAWLSSRGISHHNLLPHIRPSAVNSSPRTGIAPQSLNSTSQPLPLLGDPCSYLANVWLWQGLSDSHFI